MASTLQDGNTFGICVDGYNWVYYKAQKLHQSWESLASDDSGRTLDGVMHIYWVQRNLHKFEIIMPPTSWQEISSIVNLVQGKEYTLRIFGADGPADYWVYTSNAKVDEYSGVVHGGLWRNFEFHAIEIGA